MERTGTVVVGTAENGANSNDTGVEPRTKDERNDDDCEIPERFICPLTLEVYTDPLMSRKGLSFEREAITEWLDRGNATCPLTREPLGYRGLVPNAKLRLEVEDWKQKHGYELLPRDAHRTTQKEKQPLFVMMAADQNPTLVFFREDAEHQIDDDDDDDNDNDDDSDNDSDNDNNVWRRPVSRSSPSRGPEVDRGQRRRRALYRRANSARSSSSSLGTHRPNLISFLAEALSTVRHGSIVDH